MNASATLSTGIEQEISNDEPETSNRELNKSFLVVLILKFHDLAIHHSLFIIRYFEFFEFLC